MTMTGGERFGSIFEGGSAVGLEPAQLLRRFADRRDEAAFSALVAHHGPMVLATCRRILGNPADADDAFQATFLVLARKAKAIEDPDRLAPWLHGVARRVAVRSRSLSARRRQVETEGQQVNPVTPPPDDARELRAVLDEELARLPEKYRVPLVLCYLEGMTHDEAAGQLDWPVGTVRSRMAQARDRLRTRLARRGFAPESVAILFPSTLPMAAVSRALQVATLRLVITGASGKATTSVAAALIAQGVLTTMFLTKAQTIAIATLAVATTLAAGTAGVVAQQQPATEAKSSVSPPADAPRATSNAPASPQGKRTTDDLRKELDSMRQKVKELDSALKSLLAERGKLQQDVDTKAREIERAQFDAFQTSNQPRPRPVDFASVHPASDLPAPPLPPAAPAVAGQFEMPPAPPAPPVPSPPAPPVSADAGMRLMAKLPDAQKAVFPGPWTSPLSNGRVLYSPVELDRVTIIDSRSGTTSTFKDPGNIKKILPAMSNNMVGLGLEGPNVTEVVALNPTSNAWLRQKLREPLINGKVSPVVNQEMVYYGVGRSIYALGSQADHWGVLDLKQPLPPDMTQWNVNMTNDSIIVPEDDMIHVFSPKTGDWTHLNTKDGN